MFPSIYFLGFSRLPLLATPFYRQKSCNLNITQTELCGTLSFTLDEAGEMQALSENACHRMAEVRASSVCSLVGGSLHWGRSVTPVVKVGYAGSLGLFLVSCPVP